MKHFPAILKVNNERIKHLPAILNDENSNLKHQNGTLSYFTNNILLVIEPLGVVRR